jgi:hypothetical protein
VRLEVPVVVLKIHALLDIMLCQHGVACRRPESSKRLITLLMEPKNLFKNDYLKLSQAIKKVPSLIFNWNASYPNVPDLPQSLKQNGTIFPEHLAKTTSFHTHFNSFSTVHPTIQSYSLSC